MKRSEVKTLTPLAEQVLAEMPREWTEYWTLKRAIEAKLGFSRARVRMLMVSLKKLGHIESDYVRDDGVRGTFRDGAWSIRRRAAA